MRFSKQKALHEEVLMLWYPLVDILRNFIGSETANGIRAVC
jgi:hypothetical protein